MLAAGALEEVRGLLRLGLSDELPIMRALGVAPLAAHVARRAVSWRPPRRLPRPKRGNTPSGRLTWLQTKYAFLGNLSIRNKWKELIAETWHLLILSG